MIIINITNELAESLFPILENFQTIARLNLDTGEIIFLKHDTDKLKLNKPYRIEDFVDNYINSGLIVSEDFHFFHRIKDLDYLKTLCAGNGSGNLFSYRRFNNGKVVWTRIILNIPKEYYEGSHYIHVLRHDLSSYESDAEESLSFFHATIHKIVKFSIDTGNARIIKERASEFYLKKFWEIDNANTIWLLEKSLVHKDDLETFMYFARRDIIEKYFNAGRNSITFYYRRKIGMLYQWVRGRIEKSSEYTDKDRICLYFIEDVHEVVANLLDKQGNFLYNSGESVNTNVYYENLIDVMKYFTQKYIDIYLVDLKQDIYIKYKITRDTISGKTPHVGSYSMLFEELSRQMVIEDEYDKLKNYASCEYLTSLLVSSPQIEYTFTTKDGQQYRNIITAIETVNGVPVKAIIRTLPVQEKNRLFIKTFGNFSVFDADGKQMHFTKKQSKQLLAYLVDKRGYPVTTRDIVEDILEKDPDDLNAIKYVSTLTRLLIKDLAAAGYTDIIIKEWNSLRIQTDKIDCDYYHTIEGDTSYYNSYSGEYMKEYSWAEETNAELLHYAHE